MVEVEKPYLHQVRAAVKALRAYEKGRGLYVAHVPGAGKTRTAILVARGLKAKQIVVICPPIAREVWRVQIKKYWPGHLNRFTLISFGRLTTVIKRRRANGKPYREHRGEALQREIVKADPDLLILDESHKFKGWMSKRTRAAHKIAGALRRRPLLLSGTPNHTPLDFYAQYKLIDPRNPMWRQTYTEYKQKLCIFGGPNHNWVTGFDPEYLDEVLAEVAKYTDTVDDLKLAAPIESTIFVKLSAAERAAYEQMKEHYFIEMEDGSAAEASTVLVKGLRLAQIASGFVKDMEGREVPIGTSKAQALYELLDLDTHQKLIISCNFLHDIEAAVRVVRKARGMKASVWVIKGGVSEGAKNKIVEQFAKAKRAVVVMQPEAGGISVDFTSATAMVLYSLHQSIITHDQLIRRVWRPGQVGRLNLIWLLAKGTVDELQAQSLRNKLKNSSLISLLKRHIYGK